MDENDNDNEKKDHIILTKMDSLQNKILTIINVKLCINLTGNEMKIELNNKNIDNLTLNLLSDIEFKNLKEINLSNNMISDISPLKKFKNLKKIDLSNNKIDNIDSLKEISENNKEIESLNLSKNSIDNADILKTNIFPKIQEINLDQNNLLQKDIDEIKNIKIDKSKINFKNKNKTKHEINIKEDLAEIHNFFRIKTKRENVYENLRYFVMPDEEHYIKPKCVINNKDYKQDNPLLRPIFGNINYYKNNNYVLDERFNI